MYICMYIYVLYIYIYIIVVSNKLPFGKQDYFKYFIGHKDAEKNRPSYILDYAFIHKFYSYIIHIFYSMTFIHKLNVCIF